MKLFIFEHLKQVSDNYHSEGGLAVIARDREHLEELILTDENIVIDEEEWDRVIIYDIDMEVGPRIFVFPNAGCC